MENTVNMVDTAEMLQKTTNRTGEKNMSEYNVQQQQDEDEIVIDLRVLFCDLWKGLKNSGGYF